MRSLPLFLAVLLSVGCATAPGPRVGVPPAISGEVRVHAMSVDVVGGVRPIAVALTNGRPDAVALQPAQVFALSAAVSADGTVPASSRVAPLEPAEAARLAGRDRLPGAIRGGVTEGAKGGVTGAVSGAISGALSGAAGGAAILGAAVGAAMGAINGALGGASPKPDVEGFSSRALKASTLESGFSATGYVYYPAGEYRELEVLLSGGRLTTPLRLVVPTTAGAE